MKQFVKVPVCLLLILFASDQRFAGGCCNLHFHCTDGAGHARLDVTIEDDGANYEPANAKLGFSVLGADIDQFMARL